jgi:hypothetical protein
MAELMRSTDKGPREVAINANFWDAAGLRWQRRDDGRLIDEELRKYEHDGWSG